MLRPAPPPGGDHSSAGANGRLQPCPNAVACAAAAHARKRRSDPARTAAEVLVAHLTRSAHGAAVGRRLDCDGVTFDVSTLPAGARLKEGAAWHNLRDGAGLVGRAWQGEPRVQR